MPKKLPSGLSTFEPTDTVRRIAQNDNIEATDKLFRGGAGHGHTGKDGDGPKIGGDGIAFGALERRHLRYGRLSANIAAGKPFTLTDGDVYREEWILSNTYDHFPASMTIDLGGTYSDIEGFSFETKPDDEAFPGAFEIHMSVDNSTWRTVYKFEAKENSFEPFHPFAKLETAAFVRITITKPSNFSTTTLKRFAVYSLSDLEKNVEFRVNQRILEFYDGWEWKGVGIKSVQRGWTEFILSYEIYEQDILIPTAVNRSKSFVQIHSYGHSYDPSNKLDLVNSTNIYAELNRDNNLYLAIPRDDFPSGYYKVGWEVIEFA